MLQQVLDWLRRLFGWRKPIPVPVRVGTDIAPTPLNLGDQPNKRWRRAMAQFNEYQKKVNPWSGHSKRHATRRRRALAASHIKRGGYCRSSYWQPCNPNGGR